MKKGAVTLLDVLGWKGIWQRNNNSINELINLIKTAKDKAKSIIENEFFRQESNVFQGLEFEITSISDTIALTSYYNDCETVLQFHGVICSRIIKDSILRGIPLRGATCYGDFSKDRTILVGPAIDEVASWYERADWIGVIQTPSALFSNTNNLFGTSYLIKHNVIIKNYGLYETYCANWPRMWKSDNFSEEELKKTFIKMGPLTPDIASKFINTIDFYEYVDKIRSKQRIEEMTNK